MSEFEPVVLHTNHLDLVAATLDHVYAELELPEQLASLLRTEVESGWPPGEYDRGAQEFFRDRLAEGGSSLIGWYGWYAVRREGPSQPSVLVGAGGYLGPPNDKGEVEIGFSLMPSWRSHGYASEIAKALISNAFVDIRVQKILAHTHRDNIASIKVLTKAGFSFVYRDRESGTDLFQVLRS